MPAHPVQIHILITHDSGCTAERTYLRDEDGWALLTRVMRPDGNPECENEDSIEHTNEALMDALLAVHAAFGMMLGPDDAHLPQLVPVDTRPNPGAMN
jgi:hypothetical protein